MVRGLSALALFVLGCSAECDRTACAALNQRAAETGATKISGVAAGSSDLEQNGCTECGYHSPLLSLWHADAPISTNDELVTIRDGAPAMEIAVKERYSSLLSAGRYVLCESIYCINLEVEAGFTTTVNIQMGERPSDFIVFQHAAGRTQPPVIRFERPDG